MTLQRTNATSGGGRTAVKGSHEVGKVCDENGQVICEEEEIRERWKEYFSSLFQTNEHVCRSESMQSQSEATQSAEAAEEITIEEVRRSIARLKNGKAPGVCGISGEMLKARGEVVVKWLHRVVNKAWTGHKVPRDWTSAIVVPVHKKGSKLQ